LHSTPLLGVPRRNSAMKFGTEKLEWFGCPTVKNFWRYIYSSSHEPQTWGTGTQTDTTWCHRPPLCIASRGRNMYLFFTYLFFGQSKKSYTSFRTFYRCQHQTKQSHFFVPPCMCRNVMFDCYRVLQRIRRLSLHCREEI